MDADFSSSDVDNSLKSFSSVAESISIGNNKSMLSLLNTSVLKVKIREIRIINVQNTQITGVVSEFALFRFTGHSSGSLLAPFSFDTTDVLDAGITARTGATITGESIKLYRCKHSSDEWGVGSNDVESGDHIMQTLMPFYSNDQSSAIKPITLNQNQGLHLKHVVNSQSGSFDVIFNFTVE